MKKKTKTRVVSTERKGWSTGKTDILEGVSPKDIDRMSKKLLEILEQSNTPSASERALLRQAQLLCQRIVSSKEWGYQSPQVNRINTELARHMNSLHKYGFQVNRDIIPLNLWITRRVARQQYGVEMLLFRIKNKISLEDKSKNEEKK